MTFSDLCREVTQEILAEMRKGFYYKDQYRHDPILWDIGNGWCEEWAQLVVTRAREAGFAVSWDWYEREYPDGDSSYIADHCVVIFNGRFYDAEAPDGADSVWDLPIWEQREREDEREAIGALDLRRRPQRQDARQGRGVDR